MNRSVPFLAAVCAVTLAIRPVTADELTIRAHPNDGVIDGKKTPQDELLPVFRVGTGGNNIRGLASMFFFELPKVSSRDAIAEVALELQYLGISRGRPGLFVAPRFNADLYGLGTRVAPAVLASDYFDGNGKTTNGTLLASSLIKPDTQPGRLRVSDAAFRDYLASLYRPDGTPADAYAAFRVNADMHFTARIKSYQGYDLASANNEEMKGRYVPELKLTVSRSLSATSPVPEPGASDAKAESTMPWVWIVAGILTVPVVLAALVITLLIRLKGVAVRR